MASSADFRDFVLDLLASLGGVTARAMFGGFGLYRDGVIFALIADDTLYLKADGPLRAEFERRGMSRFRPRVRGKPFPMPYYEAAPETLEDPDALATLATKVLAAARASPAARARGRDGRASAPARKRRPTAR